MNRDALLVLTLLIVPAWVYIGFAEFNAANFWVSRFQVLGKGYLVDTLLALPAVYLFFVFPLLLVRQSAFDFANARVNILTLLSGISLLILVTACLHHLTSVEDTWTVYPPLSALKSQDLMNMLKREPVRITWLVVLVQLIIGTLLIWSAYKSGRAQSGRAN